MRVIDYIILLDALLRVAQHPGSPSITLIGHNAGVALRMWAAQKAVDVEVETQESVDSIERWSWTVMHVRRDDLQITVILEDDIRVPVSDGAAIAPTVTMDSFSEIPF